MATNGIIDNADVFAERHGVEHPAEFQAQLVAQAEAAPVPATAPQVPAAAAQQAPVAAAPQAGTKVVEVAQDNTVKLPAGTSIEKIEIDGDSLVLVQPDGTRIVIEHAALHVPTFVIDDVEIPQEALVAALQANQIDVAAGPDGSLTAVAAGSESAGGNFNQPFPGIGDAGPIIDLLPPTALQFGTLEERKLFPAEHINRAPDIVLDPDPTNGPPVPVGATSNVFESGLPGGSDPASDSEFASGRIKLSDPDGLSDLKSLTINGVEVLLSAIDGRAFATDKGILTIVHYNSSTGEVSYVYELTNPITDVEGQLETDSFEITVSDGRTSSAPVQLVMNIVDDVPTAHEDAFTQGAENAV
ncbi:hypothetical protein, partial [Aquamicrobium soli]